MPLIRDRLRFPGFAWRKKPAGADKHGKASEGEELFLNAENHDQGMDLVERSAPPTFKSNRNHPTSQGPKEKGMHRSACLLEFEFLEMLERLEVVAEANFPSERVVELESVYTKVEAFEIHPAATAINFELLVDVIEQSE